MNDNQSYERLIRKKTEGRILLFKILLIIGYVLFEVLCLLPIIFLAHANIMLIILSIMLDAFICWFTWKLVNIEYEYAFIGGSFYLSRIYGKSIRREIFESELSEATTVAPYSGQYKKELDSKGCDKAFKAVSSGSAEDIWFMLFEKENGGRTVVIFEADERSLRLIRRSCPRAIAREKLSAQAIKNSNEATE